MSIGAQGDRLRPVISVQMGRKPQSPLVETKPSSSMRDLRTMDLAQPALNPSAPMSPTRTIPAPPVSPAQQDLNDYLQRSSDIPIPSISQGRSLEVGGTTLTIPDSAFCMVSTPSNPDTRTLTFPNLQSPSSLKPQYILGKSPSSSTKFLLGSEAIATMINGFKDPVVIGTGATLNRDIRIKVPHSGRELSCANPKME